MKKIISLIVIAISLISCSALRTKKETDLLQNLVDTEYTGYQKVQYTDSTFLILKFDHGKIDRIDYSVTYLHDAPGQVENQSIAFHNNGLVKSLETHYVDSIATVDSSSTVNKKMINQVFFDDSGNFMPGLLMKHFKIVCDY